MGGVRSSAEGVECRDELITDILSRVSTRDLLKMSTVVKRWRTLIFEPDFAHNHHKNCHRESMFFSYDRTRGGREVENDYQIRSHNPQTGNISICSLSVSWEGLDLLATSNGLLCFLALDREEYFLYNPVTKFLKKIPVPSELNEGMNCPLLVGFCSMQYVGKLIRVGFYQGEEDAYTLVFDSQSNSWYKGSPLFRSFDGSTIDNVGNPLFLNGVIYFVVRDKNIDALEGKEPGDVEALFRDELGHFYMIIGYDVNQDQWGFSIFIPASVGYPYCLTEWKGNLLVCASNSTHEENLFVLAASSTRDRNRRIRYTLDEGDGNFVFWILDTEHKLWTRERELDLSHEFHTSWTVSASSGVVWFTCGYNSVTVYHMENRHWSTHPLDDALALRQQKDMSCISFEPTLLSF